MCKLRHSIIHLSSTGWPVPYYVPGSAKSPTTQSTFLISLIRLKHCMKRWWMTIIPSTLSQVQRVHRGSGCGFPTPLPTPSNPTPVAF